MNLHITLQLPTDLLLQTLYLLACFLNLQACKHVEAAGTKTGQTQTAGLFTKREVEGLQVGLLGQFLKS